MHLLADQICDHVKISDGYRIEDANLPELSRDARGGRLKRLANDALHNEAGVMSSDELGRLIVQNSSTASAAYRKCAGHPMISRISQK